MSCLFKHQGSDMSEDRCSVCGTKGHRFATCTAPGGGKDPNFQKTIDEYRGRKAAALGENPKGKGADKSKDKEGKGGQGDKKGKGKGGKKDKDAGNSTRAAVDPEIARASAAGGAKAHFPRQGIGFDSWANVHLTHQKGKHCTYSDIQSLADGSTKCFHQTGRKGVPTVKVPWIQDGDNIDFFLDNFLLKRG